MTVDQLIKDLQKLSQEGYGDLQVRVEADHGQTAMVPCTPFKTFIEEDTWMTNEVHPNNVEDYHIPVIILQAY
jgi:hypothetical protein